MFNLNCGSAACFRCVLRTFVSKNSRGSAAYSIGFADAGASGANLGCLSAAHHIPPYEGGPGWVCSASGAYTTTTARMLQQKFAGFPQTLYLCRRFQKQGCEGLYETKQKSNWQQHVNREIKV